MANDLTFQITFNSNGEAVLKNITVATGQAKNAFEGLGPTADKFIGSLRPANSALQMLSSQLGLLGPVGNAAGNALFQVADGVSRGTLAVGAFTVGVAAAGNALQKSSEEAAAFSMAVGSADRGFFRGGLEKLEAIAADRGGALTSIKSLFQGLFGDTDRLVFNLTGKIVDYNEALRRIDASKAREVTEAFDLQTRAIETGPIGKINIGIQQGLSQLAQAFQQGKISWLEFQAAVRGSADVGAASIREFNRSLAEQTSLLQAANDPLAQIEIRMQALRRGADQGTLGNLSEQQRFQENAARIAVGAPLVAQGFSEIGAAALLPKSALDELAKSAFDLNRDFQTGKISSDTFSAGLRQIAEDAIKAKVALAGTKEVFVGMATIGGKQVPLFNTESLASAGDQMRAGLVDLRTTLSDLAKQPSPYGFMFDEGIRQLGRYREEARKIYGLDIPADIKATIDALFSGFKSIAAEKKITLTADGDPAIAEAQRVNDAIQSIPDKTVTIRTAFQGGGGGGGGIGFSGGFGTGGSQPAWWINAFNRVQAQGGMSGGSIGFTADVTGSPRLPFSEYFGTYAPGLLKKFGKDSALNFDTNITQSIIKTIQELQGWRMWVSKAAFQMMPPAYAAEAQTQEKLYEQQIRLLVQLGLATRSTPAGGLSGGTGGTTININIAGNIVGTDTLDNDIIPRLERALIRATGQGLETRIVN